ncbi:Acetyltransferase [Roseovarius sp. THAF9]|uniref:GNAT family N-acetyltransferase n=1 Tax=Roseovarius sp. THAF9 TaxID=2587847 RepID=UPI0012679372|nr:GNAT family N-acetyltransferase [Roseovarius sp. THAF9]QFT91322.1 Acetyltransferase [Roseovarius sp. THAF9]
MTAPRITALTGPELDQNLDGLARLLIDTVADGAAVSFLHPLAPDSARAFWQEDVFPHVTANARSLFAAFLNDTLAGTVQLITAMPRNQPHRAEIAKMMVHPTARRRGLGRALLSAALDHANALGKTNVTLDTRSGDVSQSLYASVGFEMAGIIPDFALDPDGCTLHSTTYMYKRL